MAAAILLLLGAGAFGFFRTSLWAPDENDSERLFQVEPGSGLGQVARGLEAEGLIRAAWSFEALGRLRGAGSQLRAGEYILSSALGAEQILERLTSGQVRTHRVAIPEGLTAREIADRLADAGLVDAGAFLEVIASPEAARDFGVEGPGLEGYLFPETYQLARGLSPQEVAGAMVEQFRSVWDGLAPAAQEQGLSMRETVILASIVEKETGAAPERPLIASVFHNRLARGMRLETDPSVIYGIPDFDGNLRRVHLNDPSNPYNTYQHAGLPPGPIANPGAHALQAAIAPSDSAYLFFVSRNDGTHVFSRSYAEHVAAVNRFQRRR